MTPQQQQQQQQKQQHSEIVLFYKYFIGYDSSLTSKDAEALQKHQQELCARLQLKGRILLSTEGINGTVSAIDKTTMKSYINEMENYQHQQQHQQQDDVINPDDSNDTDATTSASSSSSSSWKLYENIDWKRSSSSTTSSTTTTEPFPDLKISIVEEIVSTGGNVSVEDIPTYGGKHLSPKEFHAALETADVVIDVRNTFEYDIGHFENAINPEMVTFSSFVNFCNHNSQNFAGKQVLMYCTGGIRCEKASAMLKQRGVNNVSQLKGGIHRYLEEYGATGKFHGKNFVFDQRVAMTPNSTTTTTAAAACVVEEEEIDESEAGNNNKSNNNKMAVVVGRCLECHQPYDELCGSRTCTVCRDLVLVCNTCRSSSLREYHCKKHQPWKDCYYSFLEIFTVQQLQEQRNKLEKHRNDLLVATQQRTKRKRIQQKEQKQKQQQQQLKQEQEDHAGDQPMEETRIVHDDECTHTNDNDSNNPQDQQQQQPTTLQQQPQKSTTNPKNTRRTLLRQMEKIDHRIQQILSGQVVVDPNAPRKCRTCSEPLTICDGRCWGFWKTAARAAAAEERTTTASTTTNTMMTTTTTTAGPLPIQIGDVVEPGDHWKEKRLGDKFVRKDDDEDGGDNKVLRRGTVVEVKTWAGYEPNDCVAVIWDDHGQSRTRNQIRSSNTTSSSGCSSKVVQQPQIYRWGLLAVDGKTRLYDVQKVVTTTITN